MDREAVSAVVRDALAGHQSAPTGSTLGTPWPAEAVAESVERLRAALVEPYRQRFELRETYDQVGRPEARYAEYWVVAECGDYLEWFDSACREFGLGLRAAGSDTPIAFGVRGDLVGVFSAM